MKDRNVSVRMTDDMFAKAVAVAKARDVTLGEVVRAAVGEYVDDVMRTDEFAEAAARQRDYWADLLAEGSRADIHALRPTD